MSEEHKTRTREMIKVMQAYVDGQGIDINNIAVGQPVWNWEEYDYRIATAPDAIDWSHVAPEWKYMARDANGEVWFHRAKPNMVNGFIWLGGGDRVTAKGHASYKRGTVDWKDSLVVRPET